MAIDYTKDVIAWKHLMRRFKTKEEWDSYNKLVNEQKCICALCKKELPAKNTLIFRDKKNGTNKMLCLVCRSCWQTDLKSYDRDFELTNEVKAFLRQFYPGEY